MSSPQQPHDLFFRQAFSRTTVAADYVLHCLPAPLSRLIRTETLVRQEETYVDESLRKHICDVVYRCQYGEQGREADLVLLFEHKSYPDQGVWAQVLRYMINQIEAQHRDRKEGEFMRPIIPVVIYHGREKWRPPTMRDLYGDIPEELLRFMPFFDFIFDPVSEKTDEELLSITSLLLRATLTSLKAARMEDTIAAFRLVVLSVAGTDPTDPEQIRFFKEIYLYSNFKNFTKQAMEAELAKIGQDTAEEFVSMYEVLFGDVEKNAKLEGLQQGKIQVAFLVFRNGLRKGIDIGLLAELTNIPLPLAERWKARLEQNPELTWEEIDEQFFG